jgi:hypothetical protein
MSTRLMVRRRADALAVSLFGIFVLGISTPHVARADPSCSALLARKATQANGQWYNIELTMHRENLKLVSYSAGFLAAMADGSFSGHSNQLFSDRLTGQQPFNLNAVDNLDLHLSQTGLLRIHYSPWNFDTSWDLSCKGSMLTTYVPGFGIVTLTFRDLFAPIR